MPFTNAIAMRARIARHTCTLGQSVCGVRDSSRTRNARAHSSGSGPAWGLWSGGSGWAGVVLPPGVPGFGRRG
jgi:hypothetical protein